MTARRHARLSGSMPWYLPGALVLCGGLILSLVLSGTMRELERARLQALFRRIAEERAEAVRTAMQRHVEVLHSLSRLYTASQVVERDEFQVFAMDVLSRHRDLAVIQWIPRVPDAARQAYEAAVGAEGFLNFQITERDQSGPFVRAGRREEYFPIGYIEPMAVSAAALGFDHRSVLTRRVTLEQARETGQPVASGRVELLGAPAQPAVLLVLPVYRNGAPRRTSAEHRQHLVGYVAVGSLVRDVAEASLASLPPQGIEFAIDDVTDPLAEQSLYVSAGAGSARQASRRGQHPAFEQDTMLLVGGRTWRVRYRATPAFFFMNGRPKELVLILVILVLVTLLSASYLFNTLRRAAEVERLVGQRTAELTVQQRKMQVLLDELTTSQARVEQQAQALQAANTKLQEAAALKDEFVAKVSHELRTPLTTIKEGMSLILDGALGATTAEQQDFLKTMDGDLDRLADLINNMLDISKIEAGRMRLRRSRIELRPLLESLRKSYHPIFGRRAVHIEAAEAPPVFVDPNRMIQILTNLFSNALKFTPDDGRITLRAGQQDGMVTVAVEDSGPGIAPEDLPKLFQKFSQVGAPASDRPRGTGLGLVVCKELVELHGGRIEVASTIGRGTTFTMLLPAYTDAWALRESFRELQELAASGESPSVAVIVVQARRLLLEASPGQQRPTLERVASEIRQRLHRGDTVLAIDPSWVVAMAATDAEGAQAILQRLGGALNESARLTFGAALFPDDGSDALALVDCATRRMDQARGA